MPSPEKRAFSSFSAKQMWFEVRPGVAMASRVQPGPDRIWPPPAEADVRA